MKGKRLLRATVLLLSPALPLALLAGVAANASASGTEFHVVETLSCNDPTFCGSLNLIDFHGEAQFNADGSGGGQLTVGGIVQGSGPAAGAQHFAIDIADLNGQPGWYVGPNGDFFITNETDTFTDMMARPSRYSTPSRLIRTTSASPQLPGTTTPPSCSGSCRLPA